LDTLSVCLFVIFLWLWCERLCTYLFLSTPAFMFVGHPGEDDVGNWVLLPLAARRLGIPFIASGGCADGSCDAVFFRVSCSSSCFPSCIPGCFVGKQLAASLAFGACGMNMGTRFMATKVHSSRHSTTPRMCMLFLSPQLLLNNTTHFYYSILH
jgi:hypothetical protein